MRCQITSTAGGPVSLGGSATVNFSSSNSFGGTASAGSRQVAFSGNVFLYAGASTLTTSGQSRQRPRRRQLRAQPVSVGNTTAMVVVSGGTYSESLYAAAGSSNVTVIPGGNVSLSVPFVDHTTRPERELRHAGYLHLEGGFWQPLV